MNAQTLVQYKLPVMSSNGCAPLSKHTSKMSLYQQNLKLSILTGRLTTKRKQDGIASGASMIDKLVTLSPHDLAGITLRSEEHTSELQSRFDLVCRLLLEKNK